MKSPGGSTRAQLARRYVLSLPQSWYALINLLHLNLNANRSDTFGLARSHLQSMMDLLIARVMASALQPGMRRRPEPWSCVVQDGQVLHPFAFFACSC